jgi:hypothetical protein
VVRLVLNAAFESLRDLGLSTEDMLAGLTEPAASPKASGEGPKASAEPARP